MDFTGTADDWRVIGNEMTCPNGASRMPAGWPSGYEGYACVASANTTNVAFFGNYVHDTGVNCWTTYPDSSDSCKLYHAVYFSTDSNHLNVGWNTIVPNGGCRALQFHSTSGRNMYDLIAHDNVIHDSVCDGINFASVDPSRGPVEAYNNLIYNAGKGPDPSGQFGNYACIYSADITNSGGAGAGAIDIYNNTVYNCGSRGNRQAAFMKNGANANLLMRLRNNIAYQAAGGDGRPEGYTGGPAAQFDGSANLWFGTEAEPPGFAADLNADPQFADLANLDFHLLPGCPAIDAGAAIEGLGTDLDGIARPQGAALDLGAYEAVPPPEEELAPAEPARRPAPKRPRSQ